MRYNFKKKKKIKSKAGVKNGKKEKGKGNNKKDERGIGNKKERPSQK